MSQELRYEYLKSIRERYKNSSRGKKTVILDEFCSVCGYCRKYAIAILGGKVETLAKRPARCGNTRSQGPSVAKLRTCPAGRPILRSVRR